MDTKRIEALRKRAHGTKDEWKDFPSVTLETPVGSDDLLELLQLAELGLAHKTYPPSTHPAVTGPSTTGWDMEKVEVHKKMAENLEKLQSDTWEHKQPKGLPSTGDLYRIFTDAYRKPGQPWDSGSAGVSAVRAAMIEAMPSYPQIAKESAHWERMAFEYGAELAAIQTALGNVSAFDGCKTRAEKVRKAMEMARKADALQGEVAHVKKLYENTKQHASALEERCKAAERCRDEFQKRLAPLFGEEPGTIPYALAILRNAMLQDLDYAWSWHCNIAMACHDAGARPHEACNEGAARFLGLLFPGVDTRKHIGFPKKEERCPSCGSRDREATHYCDISIDHMTFPPKEVRSHMKTCRDTWHTETPGLSQDFTDRPAHKGHPEA